MPGYIYNLFLYRFSPASYDLYEKDREKFGQIEAICSQSGKEAGMVKIVNCDATWASERWNGFGLERFPSAEAIVAHKQRIVEVGWLNLFSTQVLLGSSDQVIEPQPPEPEGSLPVYKLWMARPTAAAYEMAADEMQAKMGQVEKMMKDVGGQAIAYCDCYSSERYTYFGIERFPSLEAVQEYDRCLRDINWYHYIDGQVVLGVREKGIE